MKLLLLPLHNLMHINIFTEKRARKPEEKKGQQPRSRAFSPTIFFSLFPLVSPCAAKHYRFGCHHVCAFVSVHCTQQIHKKCSLWLENGSSYLRLVHFFHSFALFLLLALVLVLCVTLFFHSLVVCFFLSFCFVSFSWSVFAANNNQQLFERYELFFFFSLSRSLFVLNCLCVNIFSTVSTLLWAFCCYSLCVYVGSAFIGGRTQEFSALYCLPQCGFTTIVSLPDFFQ